MKHNHRLVLSVIMIIFVLIIAFIIAGLNFAEYKNQVKDNETLQLKHVEENIRNALETFDKAYLLFDQQETEGMEEISQTLSEMYERDDGFNDWDFKELSSQFGMDIYIIDHENVIVFSNDDKDIGMDFSACCQKLIPFFTEVRDKAKFSSPGIDVEQATGLIKKYSYQGTEDSKYIIELGYSIQNDEIFDLFDFFNDVEDLKAQYSLIKDLRILNMGGLAIGGNHERLTTKRRDAFEESLKMKKVTEVIDKWEGQDVTFRYIYYDYSVSKAESFEKAIEIVYDHNLAEKTIKKSFKTLIMQLFVVIIIIALISLIIHFWVSQHVYLAQHDSLTNLQNRNMFEEKLRLTLKDKHAMHGLMMIDLDNFKMVNDSLGHTKGDHVLRIVAETLKKTVKRANESSFIYRVGGDEFMIILPDTTVEKIKLMAIEVNNSLEHSLTKYEDYKNLKVSASIGITIKEKDEHIDQQTFYKQADYALNMCKKEGKNDYFIYRKERDET